MKQRKLIMKKRILSIVLVLCTVLAMMPTTVFAAETKYRVFVGDTYFTSKVTTIMVGSGTAGYAPDSKVLLLHGITLNYGNSQMAAIESEIENLEIKDIVIRDQRTYAALFANWKNIFLHYIVNSSII